VLQLRLQTATDREGSALRVDDDRVVLTGDRNGRIYRRDHEPLEVPPGTVISDIL